MSKRKITAHSLNITHRKLPHWQIGGSWYFITFRSKNGLLPPEARDIVIQEMNAASEFLFALAIGTVMPDHVHLLICPREREKGIYHPLPEIMNRVKGRSAKRINEHNKNEGKVWQKESFDRIVRDEKEWREKYEYIRDNAVKAGLVERPVDYPWLFVNEGISW